MNYSRIRDFYIDEIQDNFLPYWSQFVDHEMGGILNCISNDGLKKLSDNKFTWSQGRWLWVLAHIHRLARKNILAKVDNADIENWMKGTYDFIKNKSIYDDFKCCYLLTRDGQKLEDERTGRYDASIYADCFALIGSSAYIQVMGLKEEIATADGLAQSILDRVESGDYLTEPYPVPDGYRIHGVPMIMINTLQEYCNMKMSFAQDCKRYSDYASKMVSFILDDLYDPEYGLIREHASTPERRSVGLIDRHINPGHVLEDTWFWIENLESFGNLQERLPRIERIAVNSLNLGWDPLYGGLLRFVDYQGGQPHGEEIGTPYESLINDTWDMKLWWPHSEILFTFILLHILTGKQCYEDIYNKCFEYVYTTFPSRETGEWVQIRRRDGSPEEKLVALPVKDMFHILRNMIKIVERIDAMDK